MCRSIVLGVFLLNLISSQTNVIAETSDEPVVIAKTREVIVLEENRKKGLTITTFCKKALQNPDPNAVVMDAGIPVPLTDYCKKYIIYATHSGGSTGSPYIKYEQGKNKNKWLSPTDFCAKEKPENCDKSIQIMYEGAINPDSPTKSLGDYCKGYKKNLGCEPTVP
jgi:hypothetical protein